MTVRKNETDLFQCTLVLREMLMVPQHCMFKIASSHDITFLVSKLCSDFDPVHILLGLLCGNFNTIDGKIYLQKQRWTEPSKSSSSDRPRKYATQILSFKCTIQ